MKILLRKKASAEFFIARGIWTKDVEFARNFGNTTAAAAADEGDCDTEIVIQYADSRDDIVLPAVPPPRLIIHQDCIQPAACTSPGGAEQRSSK